MKFKYSENKLNQLKQPENKMSKTFENDVTRNSKKDLLVSRITDSIYPLDDPKSLPEPQGNRKWSGLLSESQENREIFLEDRLLDWKFRAESAEENVKILLQMREEDTRVVNEKLDRVHKKIQNIGKLRDMALVEETSPKGRNKIKVRRWKFKDELNLRANPDWYPDSDGLSDDEWIILRVSKNDKEYVRVDFVDGDTDDDKEWLEGPFSRDVTVSDLIKMKEKGRVSRRLGVSGQQADKAERKGRIKSTKRYPTPPLHTLRRSIAPGSSSSWTPRDEVPWSKYWKDHYLGSKLDDLDPPQSYAISFQKPIMIIDKIIRGLRSRLYCDKINLGLRPKLVTTIMVIGALLIQINNQVKTQTLVHVKARRRSN
jgi:hypothetical protein